MTLTQAMKRHLAIAVREGGAVIAGNSVWKGAVERRSARTLRALVSRGLATMHTSPDGNLMARLTADGWVAWKDLGEPIS